MRLAHSSRVCAQCLSGGGSRSDWGVNEFIIREMSQLYLWLRLGLMWEKMMVSNCLAWRKGEAKGVRAMTELDMDLVNAMESSRTGGGACLPSSCDQN